MNTKEELLAKIKQRYDTLRIFSGQPESTTISRQVQVLAEIMHEELTKLDRRVDDLEMRNRILKR